jgi:hypothetical protein
MTDIHLTEDSAESAVWLLSNHDSDVQKDRVEQKEDGVGLFVSFVFTVNMVIGAGIVGLPYAFFHAGTFYSLACFVFATIIAVTTMGYIVEVHGWCEGWVAANEAENEITKHPSGKTLAEVYPEKFAISCRRKFEISELCGVFLGFAVPSGHPWLHRFADERGELHFARRILELSVLCYDFGSCWLYATVFASTMSLLVPLPLASRPHHARCLADECTLRLPGDCSAPCVLDTLDRCAANPADAVYCDASYHAFLCAFAVAMLAATCGGLHWITRSQVVSARGTNRRDAPRIDARCAGHCAACGDGGGSARR